MSETCTICGERKGKPQVCSGDGRYHHHGHVHAVGGGFEWLCDDCAAIDAEQWESWKRSQRITRRLATLPPIPPG